MLDRRPVRWAWHPLRTLSASGEWQMHGQHSSVSAISMHRLAVARCPGPPRTTVGDLAVSASAQMPAVSPRVWEGPCPSLATASCVGPACEPACLCSSDSDLRKQPQRERNGEHQEWASQSDCDIRRSIRSALVPTNPSRREGPACARALRALHRITGSRRGDLTVCVQIFKPHCVRASPTLHLADHTALCHFASTMEPDSDCL